MGLWRNLESRFATTESTREHPTIRLGISNFKKKILNLRFLLKIEKIIKKTSFLGKLKRFEHSYLEARFEAPGYTLKLCIRQ